MRQQVKLAREPKGFYRKSHYSIKSISQTDRVIGITFVSYDQAIHLKAKHRQKWETLKTQTIFKQIAV